MDGLPADDHALCGLKNDISQGSQTAFRQFFYLFSKKLTSFVFSLVKSDEAAREIVDEVFIKIWRNRASITNIQNIKVYLYAASKNTALNYLAAQAKNNIIEPFDYYSVQLTDGQCPEKKLINSEVYRRIVESIEALPPRCKMVFKLVREDGLSYKEVGEILNISPKTVDAQMVIAVRQISEKIKVHFEKLPLPSHRKK